MLNRLINLKMTAVLQQKMIRRKTTKGCPKYSQQPFVTPNLFFCLKTQFFPDVFRDGVFMDHNTHGFVFHVGF